MMVPQSLLLLPLLAVLLSVDDASASCPTNVDWNEYEGFCYWRSTYPASWSAAVNACPTVGAASSLASIHSLLENAFIMQTYHSADTWIGLSDQAAEGQFTWADGSDLNFTHWAPGQPDNQDGRQDCVHVPHRHDPAAGEWDDLECSEERFFLCKMAATA